MSAKINLLTSFLLKGEKMKELDNLIKSANIDEDYHNKIFGNDIFEKLYTKVDLNKYDSQKNKIYWISLLIYKISMMNYLKYINKDIDFKNHSINIEKNNLVVFHLSLNISSEICKQFNNGIVYPPYTSMLCRQIIEQICFLKEVEHENIDVNLIVEAALESYNKQIGSKSLNIKELNNNNKGLLKVFKDKKSYGKLANKYKYGYMYNFFSGDIHLLSQIDKLIPFNTNHSKDYYNIYLNCILSLLKDYLLIINNYNTEVKINTVDLEKISFIDIKDS